MNKLILLKSISTHSAPSRVPETTDLGDSSYGNCPQCLHLHPGWGGGPGRNNAGVATAGVLIGVMVIDTLAGPIHALTLLLQHRGIAFERTANLEVLPFDDSLGARDLAADNRVVERLRLSRGQEAIDTVAHEHLILEAHEEPRLAGVALSPRLATAGRRGDSRGDSCR